MILLSASRSRQLIFFDNFFPCKCFEIANSLTSWNSGRALRNIKDLTQQDSWKTYSGRQNDQKMSRENVHFRSCAAFSSFCRPEYVFQPTCCVRSLFLLRDITLLRVGSILTYCKKDLSSVEFLFAFSLIPFLFPPCRTFYTSSKL